MILSPFLDAGGVTLYGGDCIEVMRQLPEASVDAIVTDPPYGLEFMGRDWDGFGTPLGFQTWTEAWAREAFRVLKPGGHLLAFAGTRTYHRMASGVEDAGFEIRDCIAWMYGSGFPKSLDVSKAIDKAAGADREDVYEDKPGVDDNLAYGKGLGVRLIERRPATPDAEKWSGWGTALKPAFEPVVVARKPLVGTVAQNVLEHGTGAINVDGCRIGWGDDKPTQAEWNKMGSSGKAGGAGRLGQVSRSQKDAYASGAIPVPSGRWPANVTLDEDAAAMLDEQSGIQKDGTAHLGNRTADYNASSYQIVDNRTGTRGYGGVGGASRFFYTAKASKKDRNTNGANNTHPTVKPTALMRWLIRLVTPPGGVILDPFGGSGSTGVAARAEGVRCILIEREPEYLDIIRQRLDDGDLFSALG